jgi:hypothetical protein
MAASYRGIVSRHGFSIGGDDLVRKSPLHVLATPKPYSTRNPAWNVGAVMSKVGWV